MRLTDTAIRNAKPADKTVKLFDAPRTHLRPAVAGHQLPLVPLNTDLVGFIGGRR
jgi:hypothetical protein